MFSGPSGAGKSTVLAAFEFLFYGKLRNISSFDTKSTSVTLVYQGIALRQLVDEEGQVPTEITIMRKRGPALLRLTCGEKIYEGEEAQGVINRMFGATPDVFAASSYLKQGERSVLLDGKNADKMELIEKFTFNDDDISSRKETLQLALRDTDRALNTTAGVLKTIESQITSFRTLHERPLTLLQQERNSRHPPPTITAENLDQEYHEVQRQRDDCWQKKTELDVHERTRANLIVANAAIEQQVAKLKSTMKSEVVPSLAEIELRIVDIAQERGVASQWEEYLRAKKQDEIRLTGFKRRYPQYGTLQLGDTTMPSATEQHIISSELSKLEQGDEEYCRYRTQNERILQELNELSVKLQAALNTSQLPTVEEIEAYTSRVEQELRTAKMWQEYVRLRVQDQSRLQDFKTRYPQYGELTIVGESVVTASVSELYDERNLLLENDTTYRKAEAIRKQLAKFPSEIPTVDELTSDREVAELQEKYAQVADCEEPTLTPGRFPDDINVVHGMVSDAESQQRHLATIVNELQTLGVVDGEELQQRLGEAKGRLETSGTRVQCPQCREDLIFSQGMLRCTQSLRKSKPLPPRIGAPRAFNAPASPIPVAQATPVSPPLVLCNDPPEVISRQIGEYERVINLIGQPAISNPSLALAECEAELFALREWRQRLQQTLAQKETLQVKLNEKRRLEDLLQGRTSTRTREEIDRLIVQVGPCNLLKEQLLALPEVQPIDADRLQEVSRQLSIAAKQKLISLFAQQDELERQARNKRIAMLQELSLSLDESCVASPVRDTATIEDELHVVLTAWKRYQQLYPTLRDIQPVDKQRILDLQEQLAVIDRKRDLIATFKQQDELELQARDRRLDLLQRLHPTVARDDLESQEIRTGDSVILLDSKLDILRRQLSIVIKNQELSERIKALQETILPIPASMIKELTVVTSNIANFKERGEALQELKRCLTLENELQNLQARLGEQQTSNQAESKKYAVLDKLRLKLLEAETIALESTVASINLELSQQLDGLFDTPISVRFETTKQLSNGSQKHCVNLVVHYKGQSYDDISQLSGGEAARVSLAITLALNKTAGSPLLLLDESLSALDADLVDTVIDTLKVVSSSSGIPIFVVLHNNVQGFFDEVVEFA